jgi:hypothetical protein
MLIISGELDHTVPWAISNASYKREKRNEGVTEIVKIPNRGHALTIDSGMSRSNRMKSGSHLLDCVAGREVRVVRVDQNQLDIGVGGLEVGEPVLEGSDGGATVRAEEEDDEPGVAQRVERAAAAVGAVELAERWRYAKLSKRILPHGGAQVPREVGASLRGCFSCLLTPPDVQAVNLVVSITMTFATSKHHA